MIYLYGLIQPMAGRNRVNQGFGQNYIGVNYLQNRKVQVKILKLLTNALMYSTTNSHPR